MYTSIRASGARGVIFGPVINVPRCEGKIPQTRSGFPAIRIRNDEVGAMAAAVRAGQRIPVELHMNDVPCKKVWR